jgi:hypothetical protein
MIIAVVATGHGGAAVRITALLAGGAAYGLQVATVGVRISARIAAKRIPDLGPDRHAEQAVADRAHGAAIRRDRGPDLCGDRYSATTARIMARRDPRPSEARRGRPRSAY